MEVKQGEQSVRPENCLSSFQQPEAHNNFRNAEYYLFPAAVLLIFFFSLDFFFGSFLLCQDKRKNNIFALKESSDMNYIFQ